MGHQHVARPGTRNISSHVATLKIAATAGTLLLASACATASGDVAGRWAAPDGLYGNQRMASAGSAATANRSVARASAPASYQKIGRPYQISGVWYVPSRQDDYFETGVASWYGPNFHGRPTANGERFDQNALTAAHTTLPIPSLARVTNLENGRSMIVRINDRGPFVDNRIIDLSRASAEELGYRDEGTARVSVEYLGPAPEHGGGGLRAQSTGSAPQITQASYTPPVAAPAAAPRRADPTRPTRREDLYDENGFLRYEVALSRPEVAPSGLFIQAASFGERARAEDSAARLGAAGSAFVQPAYVNSRNVYRVMVGPWASAAQAEQARRSIAQLGYGDARVVRRN